MNPKFRALVFWSSRRRMRQQTRYIQQPILNCFLLQWQKVFFRFLFRFCTYLTLKIICHKFMYVRVMIRTRDLLFSAGIRWVENEGSSDRTSAARENFSSLSMMATGQPALLFFSSFQNDNKIKQVGLLFCLNYGSSRVPYHSSSSSASILLGSPDVYVCIQ